MWTRWEKLEKWEKSHVEFELELELELEPEPGSEPDPVLFVLSVLSTLCF